jgi:hypothetical protein
MISGKYVRSEMRKPPTGMMGSITKAAMVSDPSLTMASSSFVTNQLAYASSDADPCLQKALKASGPEI